MPNDRPSGGFSVILGNPPWERVKLQEKEFFSSSDPAIAGAPNAAARKKAIAALAETNPGLLAEFREASRKAEGESHLMRNSGRYPLCGRGDINTYAVFSETARDAIAPTGRLGIIVPSGIATDDTTKFFFGDMVESQTLAELLSFENEEFIFPGVHHSYCFSLMMVSGRSAPVAEMQFVFFARRVSQLDPAAGRRFTLTAEDIRLLNPNTLTCPVFRSERDAEITKGIYRRVPVLIREARDGRPESNPWGITFMAMFHMANDSNLFVEPEVACPAVAKSLAADPEGVPPYLPLYEAKMLHQFDHRWATYAPPGAGWLDGTLNTRVDPRGDVVPDARDMTLEEHADPAALVAPRYWMTTAAVDDRLVKYQRDPETGELVEVWKWAKDWLLAFRRVSRAGNERSAIFSVLPRLAAGDSVFLALPGGATAATVASLYASLCSFAFDFAVRQKAGGLNMSFYIAQQLPVLLPSSFDSCCQWHQSTTQIDWIGPRVLELVYTANDLAGFARDLGYDGPPFHWDEARRDRIRAELDAVFFHLYGVSRDDADYIMDTFTVFKTRDEQRNGGVYKTKETILAIYDEMAAAIASGEPWVTTLDSPPGPPTDADGKYIPVAEWDESDWPPHIHLVRQQSSMPAAKQIERGRQIAYVLVLLDAWKKPVSKPLLERGLVLMLNDAARRTILEKSVTVAQSDSLGGVGDFVRGITGLYDYLVSAGLASAAGQTGLAITPLGISKLGGLPQDDRDRAAEVITAAERLGDEDRFIAAVGEVTNERYELVST